MLYAYFGGLGADKMSRFEILLEQSETCYTVTATKYLHRSHKQLIEHVPLWNWLRGSQINQGMTQLYRGQHAHNALKTLFRAARAANLGYAGQRFCYVLPSVPASSGALAPLLPTQLRYNGSLPFHPQLWQTGRPLNLLPIERQAYACRDVRLFEDEYNQWKLA